MAVLNATPVSRGKRKQPERELVADVAALNTTDMREHESDRATSILALGWELREQMVLAVKRVSQARKCRKWLGKVTRPSIVLVYDLRLPGLNNSIGFVNLLRQSTWYSTSMTCLEPQHMYVVYNILK